jgi:hypothetical protein
MKTAPSAFLLAAAIVSGGCVVQGPSFEERFDQTVALAAGGEVSISNINGSVKVMTWDRPEVKIEAVKKLRAGNETRAREELARTVIQVEVSAHRVAIETKANRRGDGGFFSWLGGHSGNSNVTYVVTVPARADVSAETVNGAVVIRDLVGRVKAETINGGIEISGIVGAVDADTVNGGIDVAVTAFGDRDAISLSTVNGGITLALPATAQASIDAEVTNGGIHCDLPLTREIKKSRRHLQGEIGGGGVEIDLDTTNGGIDIVSG